MRDKREFCGNAMELLIDGGNAIVIGLKKVL